MRTWPVLQERVLPASRWKRLVGFMLVAVALACGEAEEPPTPPPSEGTPAAGLEEVAEGSGPIQATENRWAWVPFSGARCMNGSSTGLGINLTSRSNKVLLFLEGGGACFNPLSCGQLVANPNGFGKASFEQWVNQRGSRSIFDRGEASNPFRDYSYVYVPYCSGDVHAGNNPSSVNGRMQLGWANIGLYLQRLVPTFSGASQVVLSGSSAGGAGALMNFDRVQQAFGSTPVELLDDSAAIFSDTYLRPCLQQQWRQAWKLEDTLPPDCTECRGSNGGGLINLPLFLARKYPERRMALVVSDSDYVFRLFFGFGYSSSCTDTTLNEPQMPASDFQKGVAELRTALAPYPNFRLYTVAGQRHVYLDSSPLSGVSVSGVTLADWLRKLVDGSSSWENVTPQP